MRDPQQAMQQAVRAYNAGKLSEAETICREVLKFRPSDLPALNLLGVIAHQVGRNESAVQILKRAAAVDPANAEVFNNLGEAFRAMGKADEAIACYQAAIQRSPSEPVPRNNLAIVLAHIGHVDQAISQWHNVISIQGDFYLAHNNLGNALLLQGQAEEAAKAHRRAVELRPDLPQLHSNLLRDMSHLSGFSIDQVVAEHLRFWQRHGQSLAKAAVSHANLRDPSKRLRVGWLSPDFREHSVAYFLEPILAHYDRQKLEMVAYADVPHPDEVTARLKGYCDAWHSAVGWSDEQVARQVRADQIDILVDLAGHTSGTRVSVFARRPAPVQVSYLGYPFTTGVETIGYRITDAWADPVGKTEKYHTETLVRLSRPAWCYRPPEHAPQVVAPPALRKGFVTFGSFNAFSKVNERVIEVWARVLVEVPGSRMLLKANGLGDAGLRQRTLERFARHGIGDDRLEMRGQDLLNTQHLSRYHEVDVALDTFPYNGTTTTCEAMWMGVPVITLAGEVHISRVGVSLLNGVGLGELVAEDVEGYVGRAKSLAGDLSRLAELRLGMRQRVESSPLRDEEGFAREIEAKFREMWRRWRDGSS